MCSETKPEIVDSVMSVLDLNKRRVKSFVSWLAILLTPGLLMVVPMVNIFTLPVWVLWITVPAIPLSVLGIRSYKFQEFGAMPKGTLDWACIVGFWVMAACFLSWMTNRKKAGTRRHGIRQIARDKTNLL